MKRLTMDDLFGDYDAVVRPVIETENRVYTRKCDAYPDLRLFIYRDDTMFDNDWSPVSLACRGLIVDVANNREIVALPFPKSFLVDVHLGGAPYAKPLPEGSFRVTTKVDGSLAIVFHYQGAWHVASKGSFVSDHAKWAEEYLADKDTSRLDPSLTYLAEMIIPDWGRIVVDYHGRADLVLLAARSLEDGSYADFEMISEHWSGIGSVVERLGSGSTACIEAFNKQIKNDLAAGTEFEGVVLQWEDGTLAKCKSLSYLLLHKTITGVNEHRVWELLANGGDLADLFAVAPDEFVGWIEKTASDFREAHAALICKVYESHEEIMAALPEAATRKDFACLARRYSWSAPLFCLHDGQGSRVEAWGWKQLEPKGLTATAFKTAGKKMA